MTVAQESAARPRLDWALLARQVGGLVRLELRRLLLTRRAVILGLASAIPVGIVLLVGSIPIGGQTVLERFGNRIVYETIFETVFLGAILFFGCLYVFFNLFRGEILERSLHYLLLTPLRREVVVAAKYAAAVAAVAVLFMASTVFSYALIYLPVGVSGAIEDLTAGPGGRHLVAYLGVTLLACIGYGSLFTLVGMVFRNPIIPAGALYVWEMLHFLLPPALKKLSVIHYLKGLLPVPLSDGPFAVVVEPPPATVSVLGLLAFAAVVLAVTSLIIRRMEIRYTED